MTLLEFDVLRARSCAGIPGNKHSNWPIVESRQIIIKKQPKRKNNRRLGKKRIGRNKERWKERRKREWAWLGQARRERMGGLHN